MPIVVPVPDSNPPLSQGDILKGVPLFHSGIDKTAVPYKAPYCLVISRPCVTAHKNRVIVAAVERYKKERPEFTDFDVAKEFYDDVRDGKSSPDLFYLGQLDNEIGSFCARLDSLHTIELPEQDPLRQQFVIAARVLQLDPVFARDLHQRLFRAFASLGFDDHAWYSTADLQVLVTLGESALARAKAEHLEVLALLKTKESQGEFKSPKEKAGLETEETRKKEKFEVLERELVPLRVELSRRPPLS